MTRLKILLLVMFFAMPNLVLAQGSGNSRAGRSDFGVTKSVKGKILDISQEEGLVLIEDRKGNRFVAKVTENTKFKADKRTELRELSEAKELALEHFKVGHSVQMRFRAVDGAMMELKLRRT